MDAWTNALHQFEGTLSLKEKVVYAKSGPEDILHDVMIMEETHEKSSKLRHLSTKIQPFLNVIEDYGRSLDVMANTSSLMPPLWGSIRVLLLAAQRFNDYFSKLLDMFERIADILPRYSTYADILRHHSPLQNALSAAYFEILRFILRAKTVFSKSSFRVLLATTWRSFDKEFESSVSKIRRYRELVEDEARLAAMIDQLQESRFAKEERDRAAECRHKVEKLESNGHKQNIDETKRWLRARKCSEEKDLVSGSAVEGTCEWILQRDEMVRWTEYAQYQILWLHGKPGCGKSFLYNRVINHLQSLKPTMYFLFCGGDKERITVPALLRSWCLQMVEAFPQAIEHVVTIKELNNNPTATDKEVTELFKLLLDKLPSSYLTVDALDECSEPDQFFKILAIIPKKHKIFITSRTPASIRKGFSQIRTSFVTLDIKPEYYTDDIDRFIDRQFEDLEIEYNEDIRTEIKDRLRHCDGMILWVKLMFDHLQAQTCASEVLSCLKELPEGLPQTYDRTLERVNGLPPNRRLLALKVFFWALVARRPVTVAEVRMLLAIQPKHDTFDANRLIPNADAAILSVCGGLLNYRGASQRIFFTHFTVTEYLEQYFHRENTLQEILTCYESQGLKTNESLAASVCLRYLSYNFIAQLKLPESCEEAMEILGTPEPQGALLSYATSNWFHHLRSLPSAEPTMVQSAVNFLHEFSINVAACWQLYWFSGVDSFESTRCPGRFSGLHIAAYFGLEHLITELLLLEPSEARDTAERSPLWWAASRGHTEIAKVLMEAGMDPCAPDLHSMTPAHQAAARGHADIFSEILSVSGSSASIVRDVEGWTPLHFAASHGHRAISETSQGFFRDKKEDSPTRVKCKLGRTPLHLASLNGFSTLLYPLMMYEYLSSLVNCQDNNGFTPLHLAAMQGHNHVAKFLLSHGADLKLLDNSGRTALQQAECMGNQDVAWMIKAKIKDKSKSAPYDISQLALAAKNLTQFNLGPKRSAQIAGEKTSEINSRDGQEASAFRSIINGHTSVMRLLRTKGRDVWERRDHRTGRSGLHQAAALGYERCVKEFIRQGNIRRVWPVKKPVLGSVDLEAGEGELKYVYESEDMETFLNSQDHLGNTALHYAASGNFHIIVGLLLKAGASVMIHNNQMLSAYTMARAGGHKSTLEIFARYTSLSTDAVVEDLGFSPWHVAARNGSITENDMKKVDSDSLVMRDDLGRTPLYRATEYNHTETAKLICPYAPPYVRELLDLSLVALDNENTELLHFYLHQLGSQSLSNNPPHLETAVHLLALLICRHDCTAMNLLFDAGLSPNCANAAEFGVDANALHYALENRLCNRSDICGASHYDSSAAICIIQRGIDITNIDGEGTSALGRACACSMVEIVECLLEHGADVNAMIYQDWKGQAFLSPLHKTLQKLSWDIENTLHTADMLLEHGADPYLVDEAGQYAIWPAVNLWQIDSDRLHGIIALFSKHNLSHLLQPIDENGFQRIHIAAATNDLPALEEELKKGVPVDWCSLRTKGWKYGDKECFSPLEIAVGFGCLEATRVLVGRGADVGRVRERVGGTGETERGGGVVGETRAEIVRVLLEEGGDGGIRWGN